MVVSTRKGVLFHQHNGAGAVETPRKVDKDQGTQKTKKAK